jgi:hypothetical protein
LLMNNVTNDIIMANKASYDDWRTWEHIGRRCE